MKPKSSGSSSKGDIPGLSCSAIPLTVVVGLRLFKEVHPTTTSKDFTLNVHFKIALGDEWTVNINYSQLKHLDAIISQKCKSISVTSFPIVDSYLHSLLNDIYTPTGSTKYSSIQQMTIWSTVVSKFEHWIQTIIARFHTFPVEIKYEVNRCFALSVKFMNDIIDSDPLSTNSSSSNNSNNIFLHSSQFRKATESSAVAPKIGGKLVFTGDDSASISSRCSNDISVSSHSPLSAGAQSFQKLNPGSDFIEALMHDQPPLVVTVKRGKEGKQSRIEYEVMIHFDEFTYGSRPSLPCKVVYHRYNDFKKLWKDLQARNVYSLDRIDRVADLSFTNNIFLLSKFPLPPMSSSLGLSLGEKDLAKRTRGLDLWLKEICANYFHMHKDAQNALKCFFNLMPVAATDSGSNPDTVYLDLLAKGMVECSRAEIPMCLLGNLGGGASITKLGGAGGLSANNSAVSNGSGNVNNNRSSSGVRSLSVNTTTRLSISSPPGSPMSRASKASKSPTVSSVSMDESRHSEYDEYVSEDDDDGSKGGMIPFLSTIINYKYVACSDAFSNLHWKDMVFDVINGKVSHHFPYLNNSAAVSSSISAARAVPKPDIWKSFHSKFFDLSSILISKSAGPILNASAAIPPTL